MYAENRAGQSVASAASCHVVPMHPPGPPTDVKAEIVEQDGIPSTSVGLTWTAPTEGGGAPVDGCRVLGVLDETGEEICEQVFELDSDAASQHVTVVHMPAGVRLRFAVVLHTRAGWGDRSADSDPVMCVDAPCVPAIESVTAGDAQATVCWAKPFDNGAPVERYVVLEVETGVQQTVEGDGAGEVPCEAVVRGLANGKPCAFEISAHNAAGASEWSARSQCAAVPAGVARLPAGDHV